jgi:peptidoglycan/LPS O-acetylase OafA/YrhL
VHFGYLNAFFDYPWLNPVAWTLAIEFQFYLFVALCYPLLAHRQTTLRVGFLALLLLAPFVLPNHSFLPSWAFLFLLGVWTFHFHAGLLGHTAFLLGIIIPLAVAPFVGQSLYTAVGAVTALAIAYLPHLNLPVLNWYGTISYSLYLIHVPIGIRLINIGMRLSSNHALRWLTIAVTFAVVTVAARVFYRLIEQPAQRWAAGLRYSQPNLLPVPEPASFQSRSAAA